MRKITLFLFIILTNFIGFAQPPGGNGPPFDPPGCNKPNPPPFCGNHSEIPIGDWTSILIIFVIILVIVEYRQSNR